MAIDFDSDYIACGSDVSLDDLATKTVVSWIYLDALDTSFDTWVNKSNIGANYQGWMYSFYYEGSYYGLRIYEDWDTTIGAWTCDDGDISTGAWFHLAIGYDSGATTNDPVLYINGVSHNVNEESTPAGNHESDAGYNLEIGDQVGNTRYFNGKMEDFRVFNRIITVEEAALLAAGYRGPLGGEVCWLSMCEARTLATPGTLTQGTHLLSDLSANTNAGDPYGNAVLVASTCPRMGVVV